MITGYIEKEELYKLVDDKLAELGITYDDYPLNARAIAESIGPSLKIEYHQFPTNKMGGILYKGDVVSSMALNTRRSEKGQNFDCMHELFHYWFHPPGTMLCVDSNYIRQNAGREWQANEGAAQGLMPRELFLQKYIALNGDVSALSDFFKVGELCVEYRISNLKLPVPQPDYTVNDDQWYYSNNLWFDEIGAAENREFFISTSSETYCPHCNNIEASYNNFCEICGNKTVTLMTGDDGVYYNEGVELDENSRSVICPRCINEDIDPKAIYCKICGLFLYQQCSNIECDCKPDSNARYCPSCGEKTTFYIYGVLPEWQIESADYIPF